MRKIYTSLIAIMSICALSQAQWAIYDGSLLPREENSITNSSSNSTFSAADVYESATFVEEIVDGPDIAENKLFHYEQSGDAASNASRNSSLT